MNDRPRYLAAKDAAEALGLTAKALRVWERAGLLRPGRTAAGWRVYGPADLARIHQVVALKGLGLELSAIADLLKGRLAGLDAVLALQEDVLVRRKAELDRGLALVRAARARIAAGQDLSPDDLTILTRETTMTEKMSDEEWRDLFGPLARKHYTPEQLAALKARGAEGFDQAATTAAWEALISEAKALMKARDPTTPAARDLARRWNALVEEFTGGDANLRERASAMWRDAMADPAAAQRLPISPEMFAFVRAATEAE